VSVGDLFLVDLVEAARGRRDFCHGEWSCKRGCEDVDWWKKGKGKQTEGRGEVK